MRVAAEEAQAFRSMMSSLGETMGILRPAVKTKSKEVADAGLSRAEDIYRENGWKTISEIIEDHNAKGRRNKNGDRKFLGIDPERYTTTSNNTNNRYMFPPDVHKDMARMLQLFEPEHRNKALNLLDDATDTWKQLVTTYNFNGYYTRNLVGEVFTAWLDGVNNPAYYRKAGQLIHYARRGEGKDNAALRQQNAFFGLKNNNIPSDSRVMAKRSNGDTLTPLEATTLLQDTGVKSTFLDTSVGDRITRGVVEPKDAGGAVKQSILKGHEKVRNGAEAVEDLARYAHFLHSWENAPKHMNKYQAAEWAASRIRRSHFDYSDVSRLEQTVFARALPFYKWGRKALPLMAVNVVTNPGKMNAYSKLMHAGQTATDPNAQESGFDEEGLKRGFLPNYYGREDSSFLELLGAYPMGDNGRAFNFQMPMQDALGQVDKPEQTLQTLLNPLVKYPYEGVRGAPLGADGDESFEGLGDYAKHLTTSVPLVRHAAREGEAILSDRPNDIEGARLRQLTGAGVFKDLNDEYKKYYNNRWSG